VDYEQLLPWAVFAAASTALWAAMNILVRRTTRASVRLEEYRNPMSRQRRELDSIVAGKPNAVTTIVEKTAPALSRALQPKSESEQSELRIRLANAGFSRPNAVRNFLAIKTIALGSGLLFGTLWVLARSGFVGNAWMIPVVAGCAGFYIPELILASLRSSRREKIFLQLPDTLDLLVVCVEAGLGLDQGLRRVAEEMSAAAPEVCEELSTANMQLQVGKNRRDVLHDLGVRTGVDDVRALAGIVIQADRFGSSIAGALRIQSETMRVKRRQLAEEKAQQTAVKMIFPLVLFIFPGIFVVLVGPAAIQLMENLLVE
jgi:tight adherence protein C